MEETAVKRNKGRKGLIAALLLVLALALFAVAAWLFTVRVGDRLYLSQTKISTFAACPYQYWCRYVLALRERKLSAVSYDSSGTIVHYVLERLIGDLKCEDGSIRSVDDADC